MRARLALLAAAALAAVVAAGLAPGHGPGAPARARRPSPSAPSTIHAAPTSPLGPARSAEVAPTAAAQAPAAAPAAVVVSGSGLLAAAREGTPEDVTWLAAVATSDPLHGAAAAAALGRVDNPRAADALLTLALAPGEAAVRANAVRALGRAGTAEQGGDLAALAADPSQPRRVRQEAALAVAVLGASDAAPTLAGALAALAREPGDDALQVRLALIQALGVLACPAADGALTARARAALDPAERSVLARARVASR